MRLRKVHFSGDFLGVLIFSGSPALWEFHKKTFKFNKSLIFRITPCKSACLYSAPSMHIVESTLLKVLQSRPLPISPLLQTPDPSTPDSGDTRATCPRTRHFAGTLSGTLRARRPETLLRCSFLPPQARSEEPPLSRSQPRPSRFRAEFRSNSGRIHAEIYIL